MINKKDSKHWNSVAGFSINAGSISLDAVVLSSFGILSLLRIHFFLPKKGKTVQSLRLKIGGLCGSYLLGKYLLTFR